MESQNNVKNEYTVAFIGFNDTEKKLIDASVKLSERIKDPLIKSLPVTEVANADVVFIDELYPDGQQNHIDASFSSQQDTPIVIRVDSQSKSAFAHHHINRPILWFKLSSKIAEYAHEVKKNRGTGSTPQPQTHESRSETSVTEAVISQTTSKHILVVDDSPTTRNHLKSIIEEKGHTAQLAASVEEAISAFKASDFQCVLMDVVMPDMDGYEGCKRIKRIASPKKIPVIMLTSKSSPFDKFRGKMAGCEAYLTKPTTLTRLFATIDKVSELA